MTETGRTHWGWSFALAYCLWVVWSMLGFYGCNGFQLEHYHGKCGPFLILFSPASIAISALIGLIDSNLLAAKALSATGMHLRNFGEIGINMLFYYFLGRMATAKLNESKWANTLLKLILSGIAVIGISILSLLAAVFIFAKIGLVT